MLSLENMCVELVRPTLLGLQQDVDTASISILDRMLQKVALGQLSVYIKKKKNAVFINGMLTYLTVYSYQMITGIVV